MCCLLCYRAIWLHITLIPCEFQALQYTHYQHAIVALDIDKWTYGVATVQKDRSIVKNASKTSYNVKKVDTETVLWMLKRSVSLRQLFCAPTTYFLYVIVFIALLSIITSDAEEHDSGSCMLHMLVSELKVHNPTGRLELLSSSKIKPLSMYIKPNK